MNKITRKIKLHFTVKWCTCMYNYYSNESKIGLKINISNIFKIFY